MLSRFIFIQEGSGHSRTFSLYQIFHLIRNLLLEFKPKFDSKILITLDLASLIFIARPIKILSWVISPPPRRDLLRQAPN